MSRQPTLLFSLRQGLYNMYLSGVKKKKYKDETKRTREKHIAMMVEQGYSRREAVKSSMSICTYRDIIFSSSTLNTYLKAISSFSDFVFSQTGTKRVCIEASKEYIQSFINYRAALDKSPATIKKDLAAVCKATGAVITDYKRPAFHYAERRRGVTPAINDSLNERNHNDLLYLNCCIGIRRSELARVKLDDITHMRDGNLEIVTRRGKGGKRNINLVTDPKKISFIEDYIDKADACGRKYLLAKEELHNDSDIHSMRAQAAKDRYNEVIADIESDPHRRNYYKAEIKRLFTESDKTLNEDLDSPYICRGYNRWLLRQQDKQTVWDRVAVLYTSLTILSHYRSSVTVNFYLTH